jgi:hypothetical protein
MGAEKYPMAKETRAVRDEIEKQGFVDYCFIGIDIQGRRVSTFGIGKEGEGNGFSNCERWDRMVGAMTRRMIQWELEFGGKVEEDLDHG